MNPIDLISASAGTGKTWTLGAELLSAVRSNISPDRVMAVTFTRAAAAELVARNRQRLLENGLRDEAQQLQFARIGTVHSVFGALLGEHALAVGRSPSVIVIPETAAASLFRTAADEAIGRYADKLRPIGERFGNGGGRDARDWREQVRQVVELARQNGIDASSLAASADRSLKELLALLDPPGDSVALDRELAAGIDTVLQTGADGAKTTDAALERVKEYQRDLLQERLGWSGWATLASLKVAKLSEGTFGPMRAIAAQVLSHPRLRADLEEYIRGVFACAAEALSAYQSYKLPRGLMDFADQEAEALRLLDDATVAEQIAAETSLLMVDEFQDTSPMQLSLFLRMAGIAGRSLWVGDAKQAIYGFRGTDPALVAAVVDLLPTATGGVRRPPLDEMRRARPPLVKFTNDVFGKAFPAHGIPVSDVVVRPIRQELPGFARALQVWILRGGKQEEAHAALAGGVARMLAEPEAWQVADRASNRLRPLRGGDIAVLVRTNDACATIASKLTKLGVKVALSRPGLMERAECVAAIAGLRWLSDPADTIALAELAHLMEGDSDAPGWLQRALTGDKDALGKSEDAVALSSRRESLAHMTPAEAMDTAIAAINLPQRLRRFGDATARLAALDALRGLARDYEAEMLAARLPATSAGLAAWMAKQNVTEEPASPDPDAVHVTTIHKAKGLEWPVVILAQLDMDASPRLFDSPVAMSEQAKPDPSNPLSGRWLRFWPWPFGQTRKVALADRVGASVTGRAALDARNAEEVRLLYVAMTRARDYLVFAPRVKNGERLSTAWLTKLGEGVPCLPLDGAGSITVAETSYPCGGQILNDTVLASEPPPEAFGPDLPAVAPHGFLPRILHPSASPPLPPLQPRIVRLGGRLPLTGTPDMTALGNALHGFLAADDPSREKSARLEMVAGLLQRWKIAALAPADALTAADRLWAQLAKDWPGAILHREWPLTAMVGRQRLVGQADLIVEHANGFALVDHKSFPGGEEHWPLRCGTYKPQLAAYAKALTAATGRHVGTLLLHLPVGGVLLDITD